MNYLTVEQIVALHAEAIRTHGGTPGVRDLGLVESAAAQPQSSFGGVEQYPTLVEKAAALAFSLVKNHAFIDGNKRVGFAALDVFLRANGLVIRAATDESEATILGLASGSLPREQFTEWVRTRIVPLPGNAP